MIRMETMTTTVTMEKRQPYGWWFDSRNTRCLACSPWLLSTLSDLNEKTQAILRMLEEDADTFVQRAEMYYEKRPQLITLVEDFYRAQRSLLEQLDHLRHDHFGAHDCHIISPKSKNIVSFPSKDPPKALDECHEFVYESEVDDFLEEIEKLDEENTEKDKEVEEMQRKLFESEDEVAKLRQEIVRLNEVLNNKLAEKDKEKREAMELMDEIRHGEMKKLAEELVVMSLRNEEQCEQLNVKDEEKRVVIRQLSLAIEILKDENAVFKKWLASKRSTVV